MADLGALSLALGADLSPLEASLDRADELINRSAAQMQKSFGKPFKFKVEVGDLAVQLTQAEGVVDRSIRQVGAIVRQPIKFKVETGDLGVQLVEAEALVNRSISEIRSMDRSIDLTINLQGLGDVDGLVARSIQQMQELTRQPLTIQVDDKRLSDLNKHLDSKQDHYARVQRDFATPLKVLVDDGQLTKLNQRLSESEQRLDRLATRSIEIKSLGGGNQTVNIKADTGKLSGSITNAVEQGFKSAKGNPLQSIADTALSPFKSISRGIFENLGRQLTNPLSKGIAEGLNQSVSSTIGSQALVGEKIGETIAAAIKGKIGKQLGREIKDLSIDVLGQENIDRESGAATLKSRKAKTAKTKSGAEGLNIQRQNVERERITALAELEELKAQDAELESKKASLAKRIEANTDRQFRARAVGNTKAQAWLATTDRVLRSGYTDIESAQADLQVAIVQKQPEVEKLANKRDKLSTRIDKLSPQQPYSYRQIAEEVAGRKLKDEELPKLLVADARLKGMGGTAAYNATANTISVRKDLYDRIQSGNLDAQGYKETVHELTHGVDAGFGKLGQLREYQAGRVPQKTYSAEEVAYAAPFVAQYAPNQRAKEMSAFVAERRIGQNLYDRQNRQNALNQFQSDDNFGFGGSRYKKFVGASQSSQKQQLSSLVGLVPSSEIEDLIKIRQQLSQKSTALVTQINQSIGRGSLAPGLEDAVIANISEFEQFEKVLELTKAKASKANPKTPSADDPWADNSAKSNPLARIANGAKQAAGKAGELSRAVGDEIALDKAAFGLAIDGTRQAIGRVQQFGSKFNQMAGSVGKVISPIAGVVNSGYQIAQGVENAVLPMIPFGRQIKSAGKNIALPAAAYAGIGLLPGGAAVQGAMGGMMHSALALPGAGAVEAVGGAVGSAFGGVPMLGGALTSASTALAGSVVEGAITLLTPILAGKAVMGIAGQGARLALPPAKKPDYEYVEVGQKVAQKAIGAAQSMVKTEYQQLPPATEKLQLGAREQLQLPPAPSPQASKEWQAIARERIIDIRKKLDGAINNGNKTLAQKLYAQFEAQVAEFDRFVQGASASVGKEKTVTNQAVVGKWEKVKADRAKKIEAIVDDNESLRIEDDPDNEKIRATQLADARAARAEYVEEGRKNRDLNPVDKKAFRASLKARRNEYLNAIDSFRSGDQKGIENFMSKSGSLDGQTNTQFLEADLKERISSSQSNLQREKDQKSRSQGLYRHELKSGNLSPKEKANFEAGLVEFDRNIAKIEKEIAILEKLARVRVQTRSSQATEKEPNQALAPIAPVGVATIARAPKQSPIPPTVIRQNQLLLPPSKPSEIGPDPWLSNPLGQPIAPQPRKSSSPPQSNLLSREQRLATLNAQIYERKIQQAIAISSQLALPPAKPLGRPIGEGIRDPWEQQPKSTIPVPATPTLLSKQQRLAALNTQIYERKIEQQSKVLTQLALPAGRDYSIPDPWAPVKPFTRVLEPPAPPRPTLLERSTLTISSEPKPLGIALAPPSQPVQPLGRPIAPTNIPTAPTPKRSFPSDGPIDVLASKRAQNLGNTKAVYQVSDAARRFDVAYDRANKNVDKSFERSAKGINDELDRLARGEAKVSPVKTAFEKLAGAGKLALGVFGGYTLLSLGVPAMVSLGKATLDTAGNFEQLQVRLQASMGSLQAGKQRFQEIRAEANQRGISGSAALETGAKIAATTYGTELEGTPTSTITSQILQIAQARGLNNQQVSGMNLALSQILGKPRVSAEEINQLTESGGMPDARSIAARSMGYTPQQFAKLQESGSGIDSKRFVSAFLTQAATDSLVVKDSALDTQQAKITKLQAKFEEFQATVGGGVNPVFKAGIDLLTGSIDLLSKGFDGASKILVGMAVYGIGLATKALYQMTMAAIANGSAVSLMGMSWNTLSAIAPQMLKIAGYAALFLALGETVKLVSNQFTDAGKDFNDAADRIAEALAKLDGKTVTLNLPEKPEDVEGKDWSEKALLGAQRAAGSLAKKQSEIGDAIVDSPIATGLRNILGIKAAKPSPIVLTDTKQKERADRDVGIDRIIQQAAPSEEKIKAAIEKAAKLQEIDMELSRIATKRSGLFTTNPDDSSGLKAIDSSYRAKFEERSKVAAEISPVQSIAQENVNAFKGAKDNLNALKNSKQISAEEYSQSMAKVEMHLKAAEANQMALNKAIKSGLDDLTPWTRQLDSIVGKFEDINSQAGISAKYMGMSRNVDETRGTYTKGQAEYMSGSDRQALLQAQIKVTAATINELKSALVIKDPEAIANVQKAYNIDDNTGLSQLRQKADQATSPIDKEIISKLAIAKEQSIKLFDLQSQLSDARTEMYRRIQQENREAMLYYVGLAKQIDPASGEFNKAIAAVTRDKNKLLSKLTGYGNGMFDGYINAVLELFDSSKKRLEALAQYASSRKQAFDGYNDRDNDIESRGRNAYVPPANLAGGSQAGGTNNGFTSGGSGQPDRTVRSDVSNSQSSRSGNQRPSTQQPEIQPRSGQVAQVQTSGVTEFLKKAMGANGQILDQELERAQTQLGTAFDESEYGDLVARQKAKREGRTAEQQARRTARTQRNQLRNLKPATTIQEKQGRELEDFTATSSDSKEDFAVYRQNLTDGVGDIYEIIKYLSAKTDLTEAQKATLAEMKARAAKLSTTLKTVNATYAQVDSKVAAARTAIEAQQKYDREVAAEQVAIRANETKRGQIEAQRQGVQQTLKAEPFNTGLSATDRQLEEDAAIIAIQNEEIQALRNLKEQERSGNLAITRNPAQVQQYIAEQRAKIKATNERKRQSVKENRSQRSKDTQFSVETETRQLKLSNLGADAQSEAITDRIQTANDRIDAPFANNILIERDLAKKIKGIETEQVARDKKFLEDKRKYRGNDQLSGEVDRQYTDANFQSQRQKEAANVESKVSIVERERERKSYLNTQANNLYSGKLAIYAAETQSQKLAGANTENQEYITAVRTKQQDYGQKRFDLTQQRDAIVAVTPEAEAARTAIQGMIDNLNNLEKIDLSNLSAQFDKFNQTVGETQKATTDVFKSYLAGGSFDFKKMLSAPLLSIGNQAIDKLIPDLFSGFYRKPEQTANPLLPHTGQKGNGLLETGFGFIKGLFGFATGGIKKGIAPINSGIIGSGRSQVDNRLALVEDGEGVLTHLGIDTLGGASALAKINRGIKIPMFANGGVKGANYSTPRPNTSTPNIGNRSANLNNVSANVTINNSGNSSSVETKEDGSKLARLVNNAISAALIKEQRAGGLLYS